jgi:PPIC-type PPIASE domain
MWKVISAAGRRWCREPLVHFVVIGALLFLVFARLGGGGPGSSRIVITPGQVDAMSAGFARTWQRPPTEAELKRQLDEYVREEVATREAVAMGLDRDDAIIRRRLRQKLEFLVEDTVDLSPPTEADLQSWLDAHSETFRIEPEVAFRQVYLSPDRRRATLESDARRLVEQLASAGPGAAVDSMGDSLMLPTDVRRSTRTEVSRLFGDDFADVILAAAPGRWTGPIRSGYGLHVVFVRERRDGRLPSLADVRPQVERELIADRRRRHLDEMYTRFLQRYHVVVEKRGEIPPAAQDTSPLRTGATK